MLNTTVHHRDAKETLGTNGTDDTSQLSTDKTVHFIFNLGQKAEERSAFHVGIPFFLSPLWVSAFFFPVIKTVDFSN